MKAKFYIAIIMLILVSSGWVTLGAVIETAKWMIFAWICWKLYRELNPKRRNNGEGNDAE